MKRGILVLLFLIVGFVNTAVAEEMKYPSQIRASTATMLSATTIMMMAVAPEFEKIIGVKLRAVPSDLLASQCMAMKKGKADFWNVHLASSYRAAFGVEEYATPQWGPQKIRMAWKGGPTFLALGVRGKSDINTIQDLKGKKVGVYAGSEGFISAYLAFGGLTLDDVKVIPATGFGGALTQLSEGRIDAALVSTATPVAYEMDESPGGLRYLPLPRSDKEGWKRLQTIYPALLPYTVPQNIGTKSAWGVEMSGFPKGNFVYADQDDVIAYAIAKVYAEGYEEYKAKHSHLPFWTIDSALDIFDVPTPYHTGTIKYFKEKGLWTPEHEQWQQNQVRLENLRQEAWEKAMADAKSRNISIEINNKEWTKLWKSYLNKIQ
jgi:TRAP transporter TAXI family solute receptor